MTLVPIVMKWLKLCACDYDYSNLLRLSRYRGVQDLAKVRFMHCTDDHSTHT